MTVFTTITFNCHYGLSRDATTMLHFGKKVEEIN